LQERCGLAAMRAAAQAFGNTSGDAPAFAGRTADLS